MKRADRNKRKQKFSMVALPCVCGGEELVLVNSFTWVMHMRSVVVVDWKVEKWLKYQSDCCLAKMLVLCLSFVVLSYASFGVWLVKYYISLRVGVCNQTS